jgi:hypothetical protein
MIKRTNLVPHHKSVIVSLRLDRLLGSLHIIRHPGRLVLVHEAHVVHHVGVAVQLLNGVGPSVDRKHTHMTHIHR